MGFGSRGPSESFFFFQIRHGNALNEIACVASVSNRVIARKLEWKQKKSFIFFCSCPSFLDEPREETLATQAMNEIAWEDAVQGLGMAMSTVASDKTDRELLRQRVL